MVDPVSYRHANGSAGLEVVKVDTDFSGLQTNTKTYNSFLPRFILRSEFQTKFSILTY